MKWKNDVPLGTRWARLRFEIIGALLASPPKPGELQARLEELASNRVIVACVAWLEFQFWSTRPVQRSLLDGVATEPI